MGFLGALFGRELQHFSQAFPGAKDCTSEKMQSAIQDWFHLYYADETPSEEDPCQRIPCAVVSKLQKACFAEYEAQVNKEGAKGEFLTRCQAELDAQRKKAVQLAMIGGEAWLKPLPEKDRFGWAVVRRDAVAVLARNAGGEVTDLISVEVTPEGGSWYSLLERRTVDGAGWLTIENKLYCSRDGATLGVPVELGNLPRYAALKPRHTYAQPVGSIGLVQLRMPLENLVDGSPDGVSVYAAADRLIHNINHNEWLLDQEFDHGAIRVLASDDLLKKTRDEDGRVVRRQLPAGLFTGLDDDPEAVGITVFSPALRDQSFLARKTEYLRNVESVIGIKRGMLSEVETAERTATEVNSSAGDYSLTIQDLWDMWEAADREALRLCDVLGQLYRLCDGVPFDPQNDLAVSWGNGVLYDADKAWAETMQLVQAGMLKPELALAWKYGEPCNTPDELAKVRAKYMPELEAMLGEGGEE